MYQESNTNREIWENLIEDCEDLDFLVIDKIVRKSEIINIDKPIYNEIAQNIDTGEKFMINELWKDKKVMLFLSSNYEDYLKAKKTGWKCFCTKEEFDVNEFMKLIEV